MDHRAAVAASSPTSAEFVDALNHFTSGVAIVTTARDGQPLGATVAALVPLASDPPTIALSMSTTSSTAAAIVESGRFAVSVLDEDAASLAGLFASREPDKFAGRQVENDEFGCPLLPEGVAWLSCRVTEVVEVGSHREFRARVDRVATGPGQPLAYFRGAFARLHTGADEGVREHVRDRILGLRTHEEEVLDPTAIAEELGVGRGFVVRALSSLATEKLVERRDGLYFATPVPEEVVDEAYDARVAIELGVATQVVGSLDEQQIAGLRQRCEVIRALALEANYDRLEQYVDAMTEFHEYLVGLGGSERLVVAYRSLGLAGIDRRSITAEIFAHIPRGGGYLAIVDAFERGDLAAAVAALRSERRQPRWVRAQVGHPSPD